MSGCNVQRARLRDQLDDIVTAIEDHELDERIAALDRAERLRVLRERAQYLACIVEMLDDWTPPSEAAR